MRPDTKTKLQCAVYAVLTAAALSACGTMFQVPPAASPVGSTGATPVETPAASPAPGTVADIAPREYEPRGDEIAFEAVTFQRSTVDPEQSLPRQENLRLKSQAALDALLDELGADEAGRPAVDFTQREVLAFYDKAGGSGCDDSKLEKLFAAGGEIRYLYGSLNELKPDPKRACTMIYILPHFDLYVIPRYDQPVQNFEEYTP